MRPDELNIATPPRGAVVTKTCDTCGTEFSKPYKRTVKEFATRRFCSRGCAVKGIDRPGQAPNTHCRSARHELAGNNVRVDGRGRRACKACAAERDAARRPASRRRVNRPAGPKPVVQPAPVEQQPVWRPAGFSPQPNTRRAS